MNTNDIDKFYISPYDRFLYEFDTTHPLSESQKEEIKKHQRIAELRDNKDLLKKEGEIWNKF